jgi:ribosomal protein L6P/L9E
MQKNTKISYILFNKFFVIRYLNAISYLKQKKFLNNFFIINQFKNLKNIINNVFQVLQKGYVIKLLIKGLGYNFFKTDKYLKINLSYSHCINLKILDKLKIVITKNYIYFYSFSKELLLKYVYIIYKLKKINKYKNIGLLFSNINYKYKAGKRKK